MRISKHIGALCLAGFSAISIIGVSTPAQASPDPFLGQLMLFGGNFCPRGWAAAEGQLLAISSNSALFSLFGTMYGGDGRTSFGLPDLRGRAPIGPGSGPGLSNFSIGQKTGSEQQQILVQNMPAHRHDINVTNTIADKGGPGNKYLAAMGNGGTEGPFVYSQAEPNKTLAADAVSFTGSSQPINIRAPVIAIKWCVAVQGQYPSRN